MWEVLVQKVFIFFMFTLGKTNKQRKTEGCMNTSIHVLMPAEVQLFPVWTEGLLIWLVQLVLIGCVSADLCGRGLHVRDEDHQGSPPGPGENHRHWRMLFPQPPRPPHRTLHRSLFFFFFFLAWMLMLSMLMLSMLMLSLKDLKNYWKGFFFFQSEKLYDSSRGHSLLPPQ